jgi:hypothetical protein
MQFDISTALCRQLAANSGLIYTKINGHNDPHPILICDHGGYYVSSQGLLKVALSIRTISQFLTDEDRRNAYELELRKDYEARSWPP